MKLIFLVVVLLLAESFAFQEKPGSCPEIKTTENFIMEKFLGKWYIIQGSRTNEDVKVESCVTLNFTQIDKQSYASTQLPQNWTTKLRFVDIAQPSDLLIKLDGSHESPFHVVVTDYENYGCFMICENLPDKKHRRAAAILSRSSKLADAHHDIMKVQLAKYRMVQDDMTPIMTCDE